MTTTAVKRPFADASPAAIRAALLAEDQPEFDRQWREALTVAAEALSLGEVHDTLESWRRVAWLVPASQWACSPRTSFPRDQTHENFLTRWRDC